MSGKFTRVQRADQLIPQLKEAGVGLHVLPTYVAICDHADNSTGVAYPSITRLAEIVGVCRRTIERHVKQLSDAGIILKSEQRRQWHHRQRVHRGRFGVCRYAVVAVAFFSRKKPVRHGSCTASDSRTKPYDKPPNNPPKSRRKRNQSNNSPPAKDKVDFKEGYEWFFQ